MAAEQLHRRIFLATGNEETLGFLDGPYDRTEDFEEAEFVIYDLSHPPPQFEFGKHLDFYAKCPVPLLAVAFGEIPDSEVAFLKRVRGGVQPEIYRNQQELQQAICRLESMLPFYNEIRRKPRNKELEKLADSITSALALQFLRSAESETR